MADKKTEEPKESKQVMDVTKPGKTAADATSRPVIVGHGSMAQDPMVNPTESKNADTAETKTESKPETTAIPIGKKIIMPISEQEKSETEKTEVIPEKEETPKAPEAEAEAKPETPEPPEASDENSSDSAVVDAVADQVGAKKQELINEEDKKKQEAIAKLVADKKYFVPIGNTHKKSGNFAVILILFVLIVILAGALAIDAGLLDIGVKLPVDLIK